MFLVTMLCVGMSVSTLRVSVIRRRTKFRQSGAGGCQGRKGSRILGGTDDLMAGGLGRQGFKATRFRAVLVDVARSINRHLLMGADPMETPTDAPVGDPTATRDGETWRGLWLSWWDGVWLWVGFSIAGLIAMLPIYLLKLISPTWMGTKLMAGSLSLAFLVIAPVVMSRVFRALDNTRPWERIRR